MRLALSLALLTMLVGCAATPRPDSGDDIIASPAQIEAGRVMARTHCKNCHAVGLSDHSAVREAIPFRRLSELYPVSGLAEALAEGIVTGHPSMPEWVLEPEEITSLLGYIQSIQAR
ncbi:MAG: cytochrome c [Hyphomonadaceae bacterium]|nr:cytochrome c [Hyphomonadaceae bacterium]